MLYDASGNVSKIGPDFFTYDSLSRVKRASLTAGAGDQYFCYDRYGNRFSKSTSSSSCASTVWLDNRVPPGTTNYDSRGNQIVNAPESMAYDALNRMTKDSGTAGGTWQYLYDAADERLVRVPLASGAQGSPRRGIARFIVQAKVQAGAWTLPTTACTEATRRFTDVHCADPDWAYIEVFAAKGITSGCGSGMYCPETVVARDQMAVFLLKTEHGGTYVPPACTPPGSFADVPCPTYLFANAIYQAFAEGLTLGCGGSNYCPTQAVNETSMAVFLNKPALALQGYRGIQGGSFYTVRDEANRLVTEFADGFPTRDNVFLGNLVVASYVSKTPSNPTPSWQFHGSDHLGTVRVSVNGGTGTNEKHKYWPYGDEVTTPSPPPLTQRLSFAAMERDTETAHFYDHARTQDFGLGRFSSPDRIGGRRRDPQTWNRYTYARNNPVKLVDRNGLYFVAASQADRLVFARAFSAMSLDSRGRSLLGALARDSRPIVLDSRRISVNAFGISAFPSSGVRGPDGLLANRAVVTVDFAKLAGHPSIGERDRSGIATTAHELLHVAARFYQGAAASQGLDSERESPDISDGRLFGVEIALAPDDPENGISEQEAADLIQDPNDPEAELRALESIQSLESGRCAVTNVCPR